MLDSDFVLGPHLVRSSPPTRIDDQVKDTGLQLEFGSSEAAHRLSIFHCTSYKQHPFDFTSLFVREDDVPFETPCWNFQCKPYAGGPYLALTAFLAELYRRFPRLIPAQAFLTDVFDCLPVCGSLGKGPNSSEYPLKERFSLAGFRVSHLQPYGRRIDIHLAWVFPQVRSIDETRSYLHVCDIEFRPRPNRILDGGKWHRCRDHRFENILFDELQRMKPGKPLDLFESTACAQMLVDFDWTPLAMMTNQEARRARVAFVRNHAHLINDPKRLAEALKGAGLYGTATSLRQIKKFLGGLINAAELD